MEMLFSDDRGDPCIEMILAYGSFEIELESISGDPCARTVSIAMIASVI